MVGVTVRDTVLVKLPIMPDLVGLIHFRMLSLRHSVTCVISTECRVDLSWSLHPTTHLSASITEVWGPDKGPCSYRQRSHLDSCLCSERPWPFDSCSHHSVILRWSVSQRGPWVISHLLFRGCWSEEPLEKRRHSQTGLGKKLMRNRRAWQPEVESWVGGRSRR